MPSPRARWFLLLVPGLLLAAACDDADEHGRDPVDEAPLVYGGDRPVTLQVPTRLEPGVRYPLFLLLHGYGASGALQQYYLGLSGLPAEPGAFVLAPDGRANGTGSRFWHASPVCCDFQGGGDDDVAYLGGLVEAVSADWPVDPARVFVIGHSNGAFMAYRLACERADLIAGIAGLAGAATGEALACAPSRPVSVLHLHGTADTTILYDGGALFGLAYPGAEASVAAWAERDGCGTDWTAGEPLDLVTNLAGAETVVSRAGSCPAGGAVELWRIEGGVHVPSFGAAFAAQVTGWLLAHARE